MSKYFISSFFLSLLALLFFQCNNSNRTQISNSKDPFTKTMVPNQKFLIDSKIDNVIEGKKGTVIVFPKGCFRNSKGEIVYEKVNIELAEALTLNDMVLSNLTTTSDGKLLESDGMIYFNATANGEQLTINKDNPIRIEIPTAKMKAGMKAYQGIRDENGNMNWVNPIALEKYLVTVDINTLDFLPKGFQTEVDKGMPYKKYKKSTQKLTDSLYYILSVTDGKSLLNGLIPTNYNEPHYNIGKQVVKGQYTANSFVVKSKNDKDDASLDTVKKEYINSGIDPAFIKVIKSSEYQNTFIATREFEARMKLIFKTCNNQVLEIYVNNLDKNLYEADSLAANFLGNKSEHYKAFMDFCAQRSTKIKQGDKYAALLKGYFLKQLQKVKVELEDGEKKLQIALEEKNEKAQQLATNYKELLWNREKYRMEKYNFTWTETGWVSIDKQIPVDDMKFETIVTDGIFIKNGKDFDRVNAYLVFTDIKSMYKLNSDDQVEFYPGNYQDKGMLMPSEGQVILIAIGYKEDHPSITVEKYKLKKGFKLKTKLKATSMANVQETIGKYETYETENKISTDMEFMAKFYEEEQRKKQLKKESEFLYELWKIAYPCKVTAPAAATEGVIKIE